MSKASSKTMATTQGVEPLKSYLPIWLKAALFVFVFILYGGTSSYEYTLDDDIFYLKHASAQEGLSAVGDMFTLGSMEKFDGRHGLQPYRPLTLISFGLEKDLFDNDASKSHQFNVMLYALIMLVLFGLIRKLFPTLNLVLAFLLVLLFAAHPIHTEVVASVKSRDELLAALFGFLSWSLLIPIETEEISWQQKTLSLVCFVCALFSKESAITFLVIIPLSLYMLRDMKLKNAILTGIPLGLLALAFLGIRQLVIGGPRSDSPTLILENVLHGAKGFGEASATRIEILFYYLKLLFKPWPLSWDYSFSQIPIVDWSAVLPWISLFIHFVLVGLAIYFFRKKPVYAFAILFYFIMSLPTNNIFFINGSTVAERFLFVPSFAFVLALFFVLLDLIKVDRESFLGQQKNVFFGCFGIILVVYSFITWQRIPDWQTNMSLFESGVITSPNSSRTHYAIASEVMKLADPKNAPASKNEYYKKAVESFEKSITLLPSNTESQYNLGLLYYKFGDMNKAIQQYQQAIQVSPKYIFAMNNLGLIYEQKRNIDSSLKYYKMAYDVDTSVAQSKKALAGMLSNKASSLGQQGELEGAAQTFKQAIQCDATNEMALNNFASFYTSQRKFDSALVYLNRAYQLNSTNLMVVENLAAVYFLNGKPSEAIQFAMKGIAIKPGSKKSIGVLTDAYQAMGNMAEAAKYRAQLQ